MDIRKLQFYFLRLHKDFFTARLNILSIIHMKTAYCELTYQIDTKCFENSNQTIKIRMSFENPKVAQS